MPNEKEIFIEQISLIQEAVCMIQDRIKRIEPTEENKLNILYSEALLNIFEIRSLKLYNDTLQFIAEESKSSDDNRFIFLLINTRTLLDVYSRFLHLLLNCADLNHRAITCLAYQLFTAKRLNNETLYNETLQFYAVFLQQQNIVFPSKLPDLKWSWLEKNNIAFAKRDELFVPENINRFSSYTNKIFGVKNTYDIYAHISEFSHGNPFYYTGEPRTEKFWVISMSITTTAFLIEMIDRYFLNRGQARDFREWLAKVERSKKDFILIWRNKSEKLRL